MGLQIEIPLPAVKQKFVSPPPDLMATVPPPRLIKLKMHWYEMGARFRLTRRILSRIDRRQIPPPPQRPHTLIFEFPIRPPTSLIELWRIGLVQNVIDRKAIADFGSTDFHVLEDLDGQRLLDSDAEFAEPFIHDPQPVRPALADPSAASPSAPISPWRYAGHDLLAYPNGALEPFDPEHQLNPPPQPGAVFSCIYEDGPETKAPLFCSSASSRRSTRSQDRPLREIRVAQSQQMYVVFSRSGGPFQPLIVTAPFTTFQTAWLRYLGPRSVDSHELRSWYSRFVPWAEDPRRFPPPMGGPRNSAPQESELQAWTQNRWRQIWQGRRQRPEEFGVNAELPEQMRRFGYDTRLIADGPTANDVLNDRARMHPCMLQFAEAMDDLGRRSQQRQGPTRRVP